jgi:catechol 2,3-dioxygenase-like lactoylglutathione lyase family enzyme
MRAVVVAPGSSPSARCQLSTARSGSIYAVLPALKKAPARHADMTANRCVTAVGNGPEIRCFFRDPDGHLVELNQGH